MRSKLAMSQADIANKLGVTQQYYGLIENGERQKKMTIALARELSDIFGVPLEYILNEEEK